MMELFKKIGQVSLIGVTVLSLVHLPVRADTETLQNGAQDVNIDGDNNQVNQVINQTIINHPGRGSLNRPDQKTGKNQQANESESNNRGNRYGVERNADRGNRHGRD
jgi:hypothetical protein